MNVRRTATIGSALIVGAIAALASYSHMRGLALRYGQTEVIADLLPISVDGMMVVATIALGDGRRHRWSAWLAFWVGVAASVVANVLAAEPSAIARSISAWPAIAFLLVVEVITRGGRIRATEPVTAAVTSTPSPADVSAAVADTPPVIEADSEPVAVADTKPAPKRTAARTARRTSDRTAAATDLAKEAAKIRTKKPDITQAALADTLGVSERTLRRHLNPPEPATEPVVPPVNGRAVPALVDAIQGTK